MAKDTHQCKFKNLAGHEMLVTFRLIKRKQAGRVFNKTSRMIFQALAGLGMNDGKSSSIGDALEALDFDKVVWPLAKDLLDGMVVAPNPDEPADHEIIDDIDDTDFFDGRWDELYLFMYYAFMANFPKEIARIKMRLTETLGLDSGKMAEKVKAQLAEITG